MDTLAPDDVPARLPTRLIVLVFAAIFAALALGYWFFLSGSYAPAFTGLRPAEASAVVGQLTAKNIPYRLADGGATILVPSGEVDPARLAIAGSDVPMKGGVGFELFNKSDMGLTDFAQRINYQRALQGELERSIMMLDDVETARVHLAMPERTLFRSDRNAAKAAVELVGKDGRRFDEARVAGIQRLVAFAVPDLAPTDVVILDADGKVLSAGATAADEAVLTPEAEEQHAVSSYYRARIRAAITQALPGIQFDVKVLVDANATVPAAAAPSPAATATPTATATPNPPSARKFGLKITVATTAPLNPEDRALAQSALAASVGYDERLGDSVSFEIGIGGATSPALPAVVPSGMGATPAAVPVALSPGIPSWIYAALAALALAAVVFLLRRTARAQLSDAERDAMVARLRASLRDHEEAHA